MSDGGLDPNVESQLDDEFDRYYNRIEQKKRDVTPEFAQNLVRFRRFYPNAPITLLVPTVKAYSNGALTEEAAGKLLGKTTEIVSKAIEVQKAKTQAEGILSDNRFAKSVSRIFTSSLLSFGDFVTNISARWSSGKMGGSNLIPGIVSTNVPEVWEEDVKPAAEATELGIYLDNPDLRGNGWLTGQALQEEKGRQTRAYRGTIGGHAWTWGRAVGDVFYTPGSLEYNILSGLVDTAAAIAVPAIPGGKLLTTPAKALIGGKIGPSLGLMTLRNLTDYRTGAIIPEKVSEFILSKEGNKLIDRMVEIDSVEKAMNAFGTADTTFWRNVAKINDPEEMRKFLLDTLKVGDITRGVGPKNIEDINLSAWDLWKQENILQSESNVGRYFTNLAAKNYGRELVVSSRSPREKAESLKQIQTYLKTAKVSPEVREKLLTRAADALDAANGDTRNMVKELQDIFVTAAEKRGVNKEATERLFGRLVEQHEEMQRAVRGWVDEIGDAFDDGQLVQAFTENGVEMVKLPMGTAYFMPEMMKYSITLPDLREVRRVMSPLGWVTGKGGWLDSTKALQGQVRMPMAALDWATFYLFKIPSIISGGFVTRNTGQSMLNTTFDADLKTDWVNPLAMINIAAHGSLKGDILGQSFKPEKPTFASQLRAFLNGEMPETYAESIAKMGQMEMAEAVSGSLRELSDVERYAFYKKKRVFDKVRRSDGRDYFIEGVKTELSILSADPVARRLASGETPDSVVEFLMNPANKSIVENLQNRWANVPLDRPDGTKFMGRVAIFNPDGSINRNSISVYVKGADNRLRASTGSNRTLLDMVAKGGHTDEKGNLLSFGQGGKALDNEIGKLVDDPTVDLKGTYKRRRTVSTEDQKESFKTVKLMTDIFFGHLYAKREAWLNRSPVFRQFYYSAIGRMFDELAPGEVQRLVGRTADEGLQAVFKDAFANKTGILGGAKEFNVGWVANYVGDADLAKRMMDISSGLGDTAGRLTLEELDAWAKGYALDKTKDLFYTATEKSNFADILRIAGPFGSAWAEVLVRYTKQLGRDPEFTKRALMTVRGATNADPDNDGKGFFSKDPNTGELMFYFPFSDELAPLALGWTGLTLGGIALGLPGMVAGAAGGFGAGKLVERQWEGNGGTPGVKFSLAAPVKSFSMGFSIVPPAGPAVAIPVAAWLGDKPEFDWVMKTLFPYGERKWEEAIVPANLQKFMAVVTGPEGNRQYMDLRAEMTRALSATGKYDLKTQESINQLEKDAAQLAKSMFAITFWSNYAGPLRASVEAKIQTEQGWVYGGELSKAAYDLRRRNPMNWVPEFLDTFGDQALLYAQPKTRTTYGGLEMTKDFSKWERKNKGLFDKYEDLAGYFADVGTEYDFRVWARQRESGMREMLSPKEQINEAQSLAATALYRSALRAAGDTPNKQQRETLRQYRKELETRYPGYRQAYEVRNFDDTIIKLKEIVAEPSLSKNEVADAANVYLQARDEALEAARNRGANSLGGEDNADLRGYLRRVGETLAADFPLFERIWNRVLLNEVDAF